VRRGVRVGLFNPKSNFSRATAGKGLNTMELGKYFLLTLVVAVLLPLVALAADKNEGRISLSAPTQLGSQQIKPGDYKVEWDGSGPSVQVRILRGSKVVATSTASLTEQKTPVPSDQVVLETQDNGTRTLRQIDFAKRRVSLVFDPSEKMSGQ
jgi:hypothetical protein